MSEPAIDYNATAPTSRKKRLEEQLLDLLQTWERDNPGFEIVGANIHRALGLDVEQLRHISVEIRVR